MSSSRQKSNSSSSSPGGNLASSPVSIEEQSRSPERSKSASFRMSRRVSSNGGAGGTRISASRSDRGTQVNLESSSSSRRSARTRRPTPIPRGRSNGNEGLVASATSVRRQTNSSPQSVNNDNDSQFSYTDEEYNNNNNPDQQQAMNSSLDINRRNNNQQQRVNITRRQRRSNNNCQQLNWYERLMPECVLSMTAPITGYENRLDSDVEEDEYEILERQRIKRNRKVRRRLLTLVLIAAAASAFMYSQGRLFRRVGVRATMTGLQNRLEHGLSKSIQDTMGK